MAYLLLLPFLLMNLVTPFHFAEVAREPIVPDEAVLECPVATMSEQDCRVDVCYPAHALWNPTEESVRLGIVPSCGYCFCLGEG